MNDLISDIFADPYITLDCSGGECLHFSQVPGYIVSSLRSRGFADSLPIRDHLNPITQDG
jgi:hypothetical protein